MKYVLITPARNEESFIEKTIKSVCAQTQPPVRWVIVDDGSKDRTAEIARQYALKYPWIEVIQRGNDVDRSFAAKVRAFNAGLEKVKGLEFGVVGNLDADITFEPDYMEFLMNKFGADPKLGVAGTPFVEEDGYDSARDSFEGQNYVAGGVQMFRYTCFQDVDGYIPNREGGIDWIAVMTARMKGWRVESFLEKRFLHHRTLGTAQTSKVGAHFAYGERAYFLGGSLTWQVFRAFYRSTRKPFLLGGMALLFGYCWAGLRRVKRPVSSDLIRFHRREQMKKLKFIFRTLLGGKKIDGFRLATESEAPAK